MNLNSKKLILILLSIFLITNIFGINKKRVLKSLILPGWGELSNDSKTGYVFFANEILIWSAKFYFNNEIDLTEKRAINYARQYAHIPKDGLTDNYYANLENYISADYEPGGFNHIKLHEANEQFGDGDSSAKTKFLEEGTYPEHLYWNWDSSEKQSHYIGLRNDERDFHDFSKIMTGVIIVNHIASAINSVIVSKLQKNKVSFNIDLKEKTTPFVYCMINF